MPLLNLIIHSLLLLFLALAFFYTAFLWIRHEKETLWHKLAYWHYVTLGLLFLFVSEYAELYARMRENGQEFFTYTAGTLFFIGILFIMVAAKRFITLHLDHDHA